MREQRPRDRRDGALPYFPEAVDLFTLPSDIYERSENFPHFLTGDRKQTMYPAHQNGGVPKAALRSWRLEVMPGAPEYVPVSSRRFCYAIHSRRGPRLREFVDLSEGREISRRPSSS